MKRLKSDPNLKWVIKANLVSEIQILNVPSLKNPTKIIVWNLKIQNTTSLKYPTIKK